MITRSGSFNSSDTCTYFSILRLSCKVRCWL